MLKKIKNLKKVIASVKTVKNDSVKKIVLIGYQYENVLKKLYDSKKLIFFHPYVLTPINFKLLFFAIFLFFKTVFSKPKLLRFPVTLWPFVFLTLSFIFKQKIKKVIFLTHYEPIFKYIKPFINHCEIYTFELSLNIHKEFYVDNSTKVISSCFSLKKSYENKNLHLLKFGSLRMFYFLEKLNKWEIVQEKFNNKKPIKLAFISTLTPFFWEYLKDLKESNDSWKIEDIKKVISQKFDYKKYSIKSKNDFEKIRLFDNLKLLIILSQLEQDGFNISIINRYNRGETYPEDYYSKEKEFYSSNFNNSKFLELNAEEKYDFIFKNRDSIYLTDYSYLGFETLSINHKCIFVSSYLNKYFKNFFIPELFLDNSLNYVDIKNKIQEYNSFDFDHIINFKKELKKNFVIPEITRENFIKTSKDIGLELC